MQPLALQKCVPCEGGTKPLTRAEFQQYLAAVPQWEIVNSDLGLERNFKFKDFKEAIAFMNQVAAIAESENHHPDLFLHGWNKLKITLSTHAIGGLSINDFILAAKIDTL